MAERNPRNPESSPLSRTPIQPSSEELLCMFQNLSTNEVGTIQNGTSRNGFLNDSIVFGSGIETRLVRNPQTEIKDFEKQSLGESLGSCSIPTLQSPIPIGHGFSHGNSWFDEMGTIQNGTLSNGLISNSIDSGYGIGTSSVQNPEIIGFQDQRLGGFLDFCSIPTLKSQIPISHSFCNGNTWSGDMGTIQKGTSSNGSLSNSTDSGSGIGTSSVRSPEITDFQEQTLGGFLGSSALQFPLGRQSYYPQQNMSMETMVPRFSPEDSYCEGTFPTYNPNLGLGFDGSFNGDFVQNCSNLHLELLGNQYGFNNLLFPFVGQNYSLEKSPMAASTSSNYCSGPITRFNVEERSDISSLFSGLIGMEGWSYEKIQKILDGDETLVDELRPDELFIVAKLKLGSKYLLDILSNGDRFKAKILHGILNYLVLLMTDQVGNCFFQKLLSLFLIYPKKIEMIAQKIISQQSDFINAASNRIGISSIQNLIKVLKKSRPSMTDSVMHALKPAFLFLMTTPNGSHLIQFFLQNLNYEQNEDIYKFAVDHCIYLATTEHGCISLKAVIETIRNPLRTKLLSMILGTVVSLSEHSYGNFVIQHILKTYPELTCIICCGLKGNYVRLAMHKCGSHVVEQCIKSTGLQFVVPELLENEKLLIELAQDQFGNYVIQTAVRETKRERRDLYREFVKIFRRYSRELENHPRGRNAYYLTRERK